MQTYDVDFHIHSKYSGGTSKSMELPVISEQAELKGLHVVGTGDALHPDWLNHLKQNLTEEESDGIYSVKKSKTRFLITTEVEDAKRVHHLVLLPNLSAADSLYESLKRKSNDIDKDGRPHLRIEAPEVVDLVKGVDGMVGPAHAFTPWTAMYKEYGSLKECYQDNVGEIKFLELGLSADTYFADRIPELSEVTFMSNSDTHSPWPHRLGREFNRVQLEELSFSEIKKALSNEGGRKFTLNVGLNPQEGKYHLTACTRCFQRFKLNDALSLKMRCPECKGLIKKGVHDRILEDLAKYSEPKHPAHRPKYVHILPLAEVISMVLGISTLTSKKISERWEGLVKRFGTEINVLVDEDINEIKKADPEVGKIIERFRTGRMHYIPGGGGQYGKPTLEKEEIGYWGVGQKRLGEY